MPVLREERGSDSTCDVRLSTHRPAIRDSFSCVKSCIRMADGCQETLEACCGQVRAPASGTVVICRFREADPVHVRADDVHLLWTRRPDLRAVHLLAGTGHRGLRVEFPQFDVRLRHRVVVHSRGLRNAAIA